MNDHAVPYLHAMILIRHGKQFIRLPLR